MATNKSYVPLTPMWELFSDKTTTNLLKTGYALFYKDTQRNIAKPVYQITGSPPNYDFIEYGELITNGSTSSWRVPLNDQGAFDFILYGYPYDANGNEELYYVDFFNSNGTFQFSREGIPYIASGGSSTTGNGLINYIPNGQFLIHNNLPKTEDYEAGEVRQAITDIAFGNWTFERDENSTSKDIITFERIGSYTQNPKGSPRNILRLKCEIAGSGATHKDFVVKFKDVNKFASDTDKYTFVFSGQSYTGSTLTVNLLIKKNFGTGGNDAVEIPITEFNLTNTFTNLLFSFSFGSNSGYTIGPNDDDYCAIILRLPLNVVSDSGITNVQLFPGEYSSLPSLVESTKQILYRSYFEDYVPDPDGLDKGLYLKITDNGIVPDHSTVGQIYYSIKSSPDSGEFICNGDYFPTDGYSDDGIPYARLQKRLYIEDTANNLSYPLFGNGKENFISQQFQEDLTKIIISNNHNGAVDPITDGSTPTGFTFNRMTVGQPLDKYDSFFSNQQSCVYVKGNSVFKVLNPFNAQTSGFSFIEQYIKTALYPDTIEKEGTNYLLKIIPTFPGGSISNLASKYFTFYDDSHEYFVWFTVDGTGTRPTIPITNSYEIKVNLFTGFSLIDVCQAIAFGISGFEASLINITAASAINPGSFFIIDTNFNDHYVYFIKDGVGNDPHVANSIAIPVNIVSADTAQQVAFKIIQAINQKYFAIPDLRGKFIKIYNNSDILTDLSQLERYPSNYIRNSSLLGSEQFSGNRNHHHDFPYKLPVLAASGSDEGLYSLTYSAPHATDIIVSNGQVDSRPDNIYLNAFIKY